MSTYGGKPLFYDGGHFSPPGFVALANEIGLPARLRAMAR